MMVITDDMCRRAIEADDPNRICGFSTPRQGKRGTEWGAPHWIRDIGLPAGQQELWRGDSHAEMMERLEIERMKIVLNAALNQQRVPASTITPALDAAIQDELEHGPKDISR